MSKLLKICDGNEAAAYVAYAFSEVAGIYPITPSSPMAEKTDEWAANGKKNIFGQTVRLVEMQSEAGACGACHGALEAGALATSFTASQGLMLMIPTMHRISGERLPGVLHVASRTVGTHAFSIFGDHSDVMNCRQTGFAMLSSGSVQQAADLAAVAHLSAIRARIPFLHFFDGFRTSHEIQKIDVLSYDEYAKLVDYEALARFRANALNPEDPRMRSLVDNPDIYFQLRESNNTDYANLPDVVEDYMAQISRLTGREYHLFNYFGAPDAERVIVAMGSVSGCAQEVVNYLNAKGEKVGFLQVHLFRPFSRKHLMAAMPKTVKRIAVLDRVKEAGSIGEPLYEDICAAYINEADRPLIFAGRYGLSSKDTTPAQLKAVFDNLLLEESKNHFTIGIEDDVTHLSLPVGAPLLTEPEGTISCKFWGLGSDGTVGANKNSIKIIGDHTDMYAQGYFDYDSKKSGGLTISHLRFGHTPIKSTYYISKADFVACSNPAYLETYDMVQDLKKGGSFLLNCSWDAQELDERLPGKVKKFIADNDINFYTIDAFKIGKELGLGTRTNTVLQSAFFSIAKIIPEEDAIKYMKDAATKSYSRKGDAIVKMNHDAIDRGATGYVKVDVPASWKDAVDDSQKKVATGNRPELVDYVNNVVFPVNSFHGKDLPVSTFENYADGTSPQGTAAYEKRGVAVDVPEWIVDNCIQCNQCSYVCPHAVIRPIAMTDEELAAAPAGTKAKPMTGVPGMNFAMVISPLDCTGCGSCVTTCPAKNKALKMAPIDSQRDQEAVFEYGINLPAKKEVAEKFKETTVKGSQFKQPLLEFSGACGGCGETPYAKLATQLFGDKMFIANATGCSSIGGGSAPATPYTVNKAGHGPAWENSLFEDNAEFGLGMALAQNAVRGRLAELTEKLIAVDYATAEIKEAGQKWLDTMNDRAANDQPAKDYIAALEAGVIEGCTCVACTLASQILKDKDYLAKKSMWILGGDGWAYDIGFGGLDHALASGEDINVLVFDTEVYSNTGGQASKSTPCGSVAQFAATGKATKKKDLAGIAMTYGYVYVAQVAMGADMNQCIKAFSEAESYHGPSIILAYAPCINHGIKGGMGVSQVEEKKAVAAGYWHNFRFDPRRADEGQNPFQLDSKAPSASYRDFIMGEVRYNSLTRSFPDRAEKLFANAEKYAVEKYERLKKMAE